MRQRRNRLQQRGATLIEVLITVVVLSVGLVAMATLQLDAIKLNNDALLRSKAVNLANSLIDRARSNPVAARAGGYNIALTASAPTGTGQPDTDLREWLTQVANELPAGDGSAGVSTAGNLAELMVQVCWDEDRSGNAAQTCFNTVSGL